MGLDRVIEESRQQRRVATTTQVWLFVLAGLCVVMALALITLLFSDRTPSQQAPAAISTAAAPEGAGPVPGPVVPQEEAVLPADPDPADAPRAADPEPVAIPRIAGSAEAPSVAREAFITALEAYERDLQPRLATIDLEAWDPARAAALRAGRETALGHFSRGEFPAAREALEVLRAETGQLLRRRDQAFTQALSAAGAAYEQDDHDAARQQVQQALVLDRESAEALALQQRIARLPEILPLLEAARVARVENRPGREREALDAILDRDPEREDVRHRRDELAATLRDQRYKALIQRARAELAKQDSRALRTTLAEAGRVAPGRPESAALRRDLEALERRQRLEEALQQARVAQDADDWTRAGQHYAAALQESPGLQEAEDGAKTARRVLALQEKLDQALKDPYRLASASVADALRGTLQQVGAYRDQSPSLREKADRSEKLLELMGSEVPVAIRSDGQTDIRVRGVGEVGVTAGRTIRLRPGDYVFEGRRQGYKSRLVEVRVPYDQAAPSVTVICDEPI